MKITITSSEPDYWYRNAIGQEFDAHLRLHPTFEYYEYILDSTYRNREYFKGDKFSLILLEHEHLGVGFEDVITDQEIDNEIHEQNRKAINILLKKGYMMKMCRKEIIRQISLIRHAWNCRKIFSVKRTRFY